MKIAMIKSGSSLICPGPMEALELKKVGDGELVLVSIGTGVNPKFYRKFWALIRWGFENIEHLQATPEMLQAYLFLKLGIVDTIVHHDGSYDMVPRSASPEKWTQLQFEDVYSSILSEFAATLSDDPNRLKRLVEQFE